MSVDTKRSGEKIEQGVVLVQQAASDCEAARHGHSTGMWVAALGIDPSGSAVAH